MVRSESTGRPPIMEDVFCTAALPSPAEALERRALPPRSSADAERRALSGRAAFAVRAPRCDPCCPESALPAGCSDGLWFARVRYEVRPAVGMPALPC